MKNSGSKRDWCPVCNLRKVSIGGDFCGQYCRNIWEREYAMTPDPSRYHKSFVLQLRTYQPHSAILRPGFGLPSDETQLRVSMLLEELTDGPEYIDTYGGDVFPQSRYHQPATVVL